MSELLRLPARGSVAYRQLVSRRPVTAEIQDQVSGILGAVRDGGDRALLDLTERYDGVRLTTSRVNDAASRLALDGLDDGVREALGETIRRVELVHRAQQFHEESVAVVPGVQVWREWRPFNRVGLYVPGGRTVYPSTVAMMAVPARIAGCQEIVLCSPPQRDGQVAPAILATAALAGVTEVHAMGGAQAIAALAYGTESIRRVDKIVGPGNAYVTAAKLQVVGEVAIDMPAGPSEVVVVSDGSANPLWLAADLRAQAEHSPDAIAMLVTTSAADAAVLEDIPPEQIRGFQCETIAEAIVFANDFAPEHLTLACRDARRWLPLVRAAGSVFVGPYAPPAAGDYATGANHVLPTGGAARSFGALGVSDFGRAIQVQAIDADGIEAVAAVTDVLARLEALPWHARSVRLRSET
ncbi:MAG TPA: histidinol dehydrogenase [Candidatus Dormibacteraeota bacterium]